MTTAAETLRIAAAQVAARADEVYPIDIFGESLTSEEWVTVRAAIRPITTERLAADIYRRGFAAIAYELREMARDAEDTADDAH